MNYTRGQLDLVKYSTMVNYVDTFTFELLTRERHHRFEIGEMEYYR